MNLKVNRDFPGAKEYSDVFDLRILEMNPSCKPRYLLAFRQTAQNEKKLKVFCENFQITDECGKAGQKKKKPPVSEGPSFKP